ncbi:sensor histidine kinase [Streptomyces sp. NPDC001515]
MIRAAAWRDSRTAVSRRAGAPRRGGVLLMALCLLAFAEAFAESVAVHDPVARLFAHGAGHTDPRADAAGLQLAALVALLCLCTALSPALLPPLPAGAVVTLVSLGSLALLHTLTAAGVAAQLLVTYRLARHGHTAAAALCVPFLLAPALASAIGVQDGTGYRVRTLLLASLVPVAAFAGLVRRAAEHDREHRAVRAVLADSRGVNAAREERARIVRELHDVVGHHVSMIAVQAETARVATPGMPAAGRERLLGIGDTARATLTEMRRLLGVLRDDDTVPAGVRTPQPDLGRLDALLDEARGASTATIRLVLSGTPRRMDPGTELAAYRVVQESLTNARKHAAGAPVDIRLHYAPGTLRLSIRDHGPAAPSVPPDCGHGLLGMRERVASVGGLITAGPADSGGFAVEAVFPAEPERAPRPHRPAEPERTP